MVHARAEGVFIIEHYFAVREAFNNVYPDNKVQNKTIPRLVTTFRVTENVYL
jgi:hypothetical protein